MGTDRLRYMVATYGYKQVEQWLACMHAELAPVV